MGCLIIIVFAFAVGVVAGAICQAYLAGLDGDLDPIAGVPGSSGYAQAVVAYLRLHIGLRHHARDIQLALDLVAPGFRISQPEQTLAIQQSLWAAGTATFRTFGRLLMR